MESKYLSQFENVKDAYKLRGNRLLVEPLPKEELKSAGGLLLAAPLSDHKSTLDQNRACLATVLAVGEGYLNEDGSDEPMDVEVGNVILLSVFGLRMFSNFPGVRGYSADGIALIRDTDISQVWKSLDDYEVYKALLGSHADKA